MPHPPDTSADASVSLPHPSGLETAALAAVLEHSDDAIFCKTLDNVITLWSRGAARVYGYSNDEILGQSVERLLPPDRPNEAKQLIRRVARGEQIEHFETVRLTRSGEQRRVLLTLTPLRDAAGRIGGALTIARDISAYRQAEATAHEAEQQFQATFERAAVGIALVDTAGRWLRVNERLCAIMGYAREDLLARPFQEITHPDDREAGLDHARRLLNGEIDDYSLERRYVHRNGHLGWVSLSVSLARSPTGEPCYFIAVLEDITWRKEAEAALNHLEKQARERALLLDTASRVALGVLSSQTGIAALQHIADAARTLAGARYAALGVARRDGQGLSEFITAGLSPEEEARIGPRPQGRGVLGHLLRRREPLRIDALAAHPSAVGFPPNHPTMGTFLGVPICRGETVVGSLYLTDKVGGGPFTLEDELAVQALGAYAAVAINNLETLSRKRELVRGLIAAQEDERRAIAYDLHDGLTQYVMASHAHLEAFRRASLDGKAERAEQELNRGLTYLNEAVAESRRLVSGLRALALDDLGLAGALETHLAEEKARAGWNEAEFVHNIAARRFDAMLETTVYRVAQEALTNARKHAGASHVRLVLLEEAPPDSARRLTLEVRDWGRGFDPDAAASDTERVGLHSMSERVSLLNGAYCLISAPDRGTTVRAVFPVPAPPTEKGAP